MLVLDGISDPGNMGSLIRSAVSFDVHSIVIIGGCDIWSPKVIRSSMGSILGTRIIELESWTELDAQMSRLGQEHPSLAPALFLADGGEQSVSVHSCDFPGAGCCFLAVGSEAFGLSREARQVAARRRGVFVKIPISARVESLNAAIAGSIILSEIKRQHSL